MRGGLEPPSVDRPLARDRWIDEVEEAEVLAQAAADPYDLEAIRRARNLADVVETESPEAPRDPVDADRIAVGDLEDAPRVEALGVEDAGEEALAPAVLGDPRPVDQLGHPLHPCGRLRTYGHRRRGTMAGCQLGEFPGRYVCVRAKPM